MELERATQIVLDSWIEQAQGDSRFQNATESKRNELIESCRPRAEKAARKLLELIKERDAVGLPKVLHTGNVGLRRVFAEITFITLPKTEKGTRETIRQFIGEAEFDRQIAERDEQRAEERAKYERDAETRQREAALDECCRYAVGGSGLVRVVTYRQFLQDLVFGRGFRTLSQRKRGCFSVWDLAGDRGTYELRKRYHADYAAELIAGVEAGHELRIESLLDTVATCSAGDWVYTQPAVDREQEHEIRFRVYAAFAEHLRIVKRLGPHAATLNEALRC